MARTQGWANRSRLTKKQSGRMVRDLPKSVLEKYRKTHPLYTAAVPALQTEKPLRKMRGLGPAGRLPREGPGDFRYVGDVPIYRTRRNGVPEPVPYVYGASRGTRSFANLDLAAIAAADRELNGRPRKGPGTWPRNTMAAQAASVRRREELAMERLEAQEARCEVCGYTLVSQGHRLTCLRDVPDAEPPQPTARRMRPEDRARIRGAA